MKKIYLFFLFLLLHCLPNAQVSFQSPVFINLCLSNYFLKEVGNFDRDSLNELFLVSEGFSSDTSVNNKIILFKFENGSIIQKKKVNFQHTGFYLNSLTSGDLNNDSLRDLVISYMDTVKIFFNSENNYFSESNSTSFYSGNNVVGLACGDLNNDSLCDLAVSFWHEDSLKIYYQNKKGGFTKKSYYKQVSVCNKLLIKDINNDGLNDVVLSNGWYVSGLVTNANKYSFAIYLQDPTNHFLQNHLLFWKSTNDLYYNYVAGFDVGDLNNDGLMDIATVSDAVGNSGLSIWFQDSSYNLMFHNYPATIPTLHAPGTVTIRDFDNDSKNEIVIAHEVEACVSVFEPDANYQYFAYSVFSAIFDPESCSHSMVVGDLNGDHRIDAVTNCGNGCGILFNNSVNNIFQISNTKYNLFIYPNPATDQITFTLQDIQNLSNSTLFIYNLQGQPILQQNLTNDNTQIDISQLVPGIYIAKIQTDSETLVKKFIKE